MIAGIWNTMPIARMNVVTKERYSAQRSWLSITLPPMFVRKPRADGSRKK